MTNAEKSVKLLSNRSATFRPENLKIISISEEWGLCLVAYGKKRFTNSPK